jgi:hypothetical protein
VMFGGGEYADETIHNSKIAWDISQLAGAPEAGSIPGVAAQAISTWGFRSAVLAFPLALLYLLFGVNTLTTMILPLLSTVFVLVLIYKIGLAIRSSVLGFWMTFLFVVVPLNLYNTTVYSASNFILLFSLLAIYFAIQASRSKTNRRRISFIAGILISAGLSFFLAEWAIWVLVFVSFILTRDQKKWFAAVLFGAMIVWIVLLFRYLDSSVLGQASWLAALFSIAGVPAILLFSVAGVVRQQKANKDMFTLFGIWLVTYLLWTLPYYSSGEGGFFQLALLPLVAFAAMFFEEAKDASLAILACLLSILFLVLVVCAIFPVNELVPGLLTMTVMPSWQVHNPILTVSTVVGGLLFYFVILTLFGSQLMKIHIKPGYFAMAALLLIVGLISPIFTQVVASRSSRLKPNDVLATISAYELALPLYVEDEMSADFLRYAQGYSSKITQVHAFEGFSKIPEDAYLLFNSNMDLPEGEAWWVMQQYRSANQVFWLARKLSVSSAQQELAVAAQLKEDLVPAGGSRFIGALTNLGDFCEAYAEWMRQSATLYRTVVFISITHTDCFDTSDEQVNLAETMGQPRAWLTLPGRAILVESVREGGSEDYNFAVGYHPFDSVFYDNSSLFSQQRIESNSFYLFKARLSAEGQASPLYWRIGTQEGLAFTNISIPEQEEFVILIHIPQGTGAKRIFLSPALFASPDSRLFVNEVFFQKIHPDLFPSGQ